MLPAMTATPEFSPVIAVGTDMGNAEDAAMTLAEAVEEALGVGASALELNQVSGSPSRRPELAGDDFVRNY